MAAEFSVREAFKGKSVLLTGVTGYVGSLVLEQILRVCPDVGRVYVLIRPKKNVDAHRRLELLVNSGLFHKLWDKEDVLGKVQLVEGDVTEPDLGLHPVNKEEVLQNVQIVIHCAAAINLDDPIQTTVRNNYLSTQNLLELCRQMSILKAYAHVSTAYVGVTHPRGSTVKEKIYPLMNGDAVASHQEIVKEIMRLPEQDANTLAELLMARWGFPCTYSFGKYLSEQLVSDYHRNHFPCAIVRPSFITGMDKGPYPGYIGNMAGPAGHAIAFALGFFGKNSLAWKGDGIIDVIPGDVVSSLTIAAAASTVQGTFPCKEDDIPIFHGTSSTTYPISNSEVFKRFGEFFEKERPPMSLLWGKYPSFGPNYKPDPKLVKKAKKRTYRKVQALAWLLTRMGKPRQALKLRIGYRAWDYANQAKFDMHLFFSTENTRKLHEMIIDEEKEDIRCLFTPLNGDWRRHLRVYLSGLKTLLLRTPINCKAEHDFQPIPPCDPPISLPRPLERRPSLISPYAISEESSSQSDTDSPTAAAIHNMVRTLSK